MEFDEEQKKILENYKLTKFQENPALEAIYNEVEKSAEYYKEIQASEYKVNPTIP